VVVVAPGITLSLAKTVGQEGAEAQAQVQTLHLEVLQPKDLVAEELVTGILEEPE